MWKLMFVSCTSNLLARTCGFRNFIRFRPLLILNPLRHLQNQNLGIIQIYIVVQCFPHFNIVWIHWCDECKRSNVLNVCHMLSTISWWHEQVCSLTIEYQVFQFGAKYKLFKTIFEHTLVKWWSSKQGVETLNNCLQSHNVLSTHFFSHVLPYHMTTRQFFAGGLSHSSNLPVAPVLLAPEWTVVKRALCRWSHRRVSRQTSTRAPRRWIAPGRWFQ